jgi:hypothetical protein
MEPGGKRKREKWKNKEVGGRGKVGKAVSMGRMEGRVA